VSVRAIRRIDEPHWAWHVGLDAESSDVLNELWSGREVDAGRMRRVLALFALQFDDPAAMRADIAGRVVYLGLCADEHEFVRMRPVGAQGRVHRRSGAALPRWRDPRAALARHG